MYMGKNIKNILKMINTVIQMHMQLLFFFLVVGGV